MARLDRLGGAREVAQIAAVIGRQFTLALLEAVAGKDAAELDAALARLVAAGVVFPEERGLEPSFIFKHALVRDVAYESLLLMRRREWHARLAHAHADVSEHRAQCPAARIRVPFLPGGCRKRKVRGDL